MQLSENDDRCDLSFIERGNRYRELMKDNGWTAAELAKRVHRNPSQISTALSVEANCPPELKAAVEAGTVTERAAYAASQITDADVRAENAKGLMDRTLTEEDVRAAAKKNPRTRRGRPPAAKNPPSKVTVPTYSEGVDVAGGFRVVVICNGHTDSPGKEAMAAAAEAAAKMFREDAA